MIQENNVKKYCAEDISLIENYHQAIADKQKKWEIHHRKECDSEGRTLFTCKQLVEINLYFDRPASELLFVTRSMHKKIHREDSAKGGKSQIRIEKRSIPILQFTKDGTFIKEWPSLSEAGRQLKTSTGNICSCCEGNRKSAGGYVWKYKKA